MFFLFFWLRLWLGEAGVCIQRPDYGTGIDNLCVIEKAECFFSSSFLLPSSLKGSISHYQSAFLGTWCSYAFKAICSETVWPMGLRLHFFETKGSLFTWILNCHESIMLVKSSCFLPSDLANSCPSLTAWAVNLPRSRCLWRVPEDLWEAQTCSVISDNTAEPQAVLHGQPALKVCLCSLHL